MTKRATALRAAARLQERGPTKAQTAVLQRVMAGHTLFHYLRFSETVAFTGSRTLISARTRNVLIRNGWVDGGRLTESGRAALSAAAGREATR